MTGFQSPNYTQVPNDLFDAMMRDMDMAEIKVVLAVLRGTLGWHRNEFQMSIRKMADLTGLSIASVQAGAKKAEDRGLIERVKDGQNSTYWKAVIGVSEIDTPVYQDLIQPVPDIDTQSRVKESSKETKKETPPTVFVLAKSLADVCQMDFEINKGRLLAEAKKLAKGSPAPTPESIKKYYNGGGWWWENDWRGKKGESPTPATIRETWGRWQSVSPKTAGDKRNILEGV